MTPRQTADSILRSFRDSPWVWFLGLIVATTIWVSRVESAQTAHSRELMRLESVKVDRREQAVFEDRVMEQLRAIRSNQDSISVRLHDIICDDKPRFCR